MSDDKQMKFEEYKYKKEQLLLDKNPVKLVRLKKAIRPVLRSVLFVQRKLNGQSIEFINRRIPKMNKPVVFAVSHIGKYDFEMVNEVIPQHFHVIVSDFINMYGNINGLFMQANGVIFVDVVSKKDRENSRKMMLKVLEAGDNMMIFPEGTWNLSENEIIRDIHFGAVDIALEKETVIVPIAIEQYGKRFVINIGDIFDPNIIKNKITDVKYSELDTKNSEKQSVKLQIKYAATRKLRDCMATLKWEIWEREGTIHRTDIPYDYWKCFIQDRCEEWAGYSMDEQILNGCFPPDKREYNNMLNSIMHMKVRKENEFLFHT